MKVSGTVVLAAVVAGMAAFSAVQAQEKKIKREDLPAAVEKTVAEQSKDATVKGFQLKWKRGRSFTKRN
jgi:ATP-dependent 26S proteasome regulatory subunit